MKQARAITFLVVASATLGAVFACTAFNDAVVGENEGGATTDVEASTPPNEAGCTSVRLPPPPPAMPDEGETSFTTVLREMTFTPDGGSPAQYSFDLDESCTCPERETCTPADAGTGPRCDLEGGVDNAGGVLLSGGSILGFPLTDLGTVVKEGIEKGDNGIVMSVDGYNEKPDDPSVEVSIYRSYGPRDDGGVKKTPEFLPAEKWTRVRDDVEGASRPKSISAYVTGGVLVAILERSYLPFKDSFIELQEGRLVANLEKRGSSYALTNGRIVGRWTTKNLLQNLIYIVPPGNNGKRVCEDATSMAIFETATIKNVVCHAADITRSAALDKTSAACDALSVGAGFEAVPVVAGDTVDLVTVDVCAGVEAKDCPR